MTAPLPYDLMQSCLLDLLYELRDTEIPIILGGGYGIYQKRRQALASGEQLLIPLPPPARSTSDIDVFLTSELLADQERLPLFRDSLQRLGYRVIETAKYYHFVRTLPYAGSERDVKIDLLTREPDQERYPQLKADSRRVGPRKSIQLHAHITPEAFAIEDRLIPLRMEGVRTDGSPYHATVFLPQTYPYLVMKLFAFHDQHDREEKGFGREHALDLYSLTAIMTAPEFQEARELATQYQNHPRAQEAIRLVRDEFSHPEAIGLLRLREHRLFTNDIELHRFIEALSTLFTV
jgi:hypothetical protein